MAPTISLEMAERMLIKFDGNKNKLFEFLDNNCDKAMSLVDPQYKEILFKLIETKITDNARAVVRNREFPTWNAFLDAFSEKIPIGQWQWESVMSFANRVESCYIRQ